MKRARVTILIVLGLLSATLFILLVRLRQNPLNAELQKVNAAVESGHPEEAVRLLQKVISMYPADRGVRLALFHAQAFAYKKLRQSDRNAATEYRNKAIEGLTGFPIDEAESWASAEIYTILEQPDLALIAYQQTVALASAKLESLQTGKLFTNYEVSDEQRATLLKGYQELIEKAEQRTLDLEQSKGSTLQKPLKNSH